MWVSLSKGRISMANKKSNPSDTELRRQEIIKLGKKAKKLNTEMQQKLSEFRQKGADVENDYYVVKTARDIDEILAKSRPTQKDLDRMKDFSKVTQYDYVKVDKVAYKDIRKGYYLAKRINKALDTAQTMYTDKSPFKGNSKYTALLDPLMNKISDEYYELSNYDKSKPAQLLEHVRFDYIPQEDKVAKQFGQQILNLDWSSQKNIDEWKSNNAHKGYEVLVKKHNIPKSTYVMLEEIMNTSAAWEVVMKGQKPSNGDGRIEQRWKKLFDKVEETSDNIDLLDEVHTMIENEEDYNQIIGYIDDALLKIKAGESLMGYKEWLDKDKK